MSNTKKRNLKESNVSLNERLLTTSLGAWLLGKDIGIRFRGSKEEIAAISSALLSSKSLQEELNRDGTTIESIMEKLKAKRESARQFEKVLGMSWPL